VFQLTWMILHLAAAMMHAGSALYHMRRIQKEPDLPTEP
jgi:hypothetical protein